MTDRRSDTHVFDIYFKSYFSDENAFTNKAECCFHLYEVRRYLHQMPENQDTKQLISDSYSYLQTLTLGLQSFNFDSFIVEHFINKNKDQLFQNQPTAEDLIAYINNYHYITHHTRPSDSAKNEILKRLRIN